MPGPRYLPPEIWTNMIQCLHPNDRTPCLSVSKSLHDISLPLVFSHITVRFGIRRNTDDLLEDWTEDQKVAANNATRVSHELLQHIVRTPEFARVVTKVTVRAYTPEGDPHSDDLIGECSSFQKSIDNARETACSLILRSCVGWRAQYPPPPRVLLVWLWSRTPGGSHMRSCRCFLCLFIRTTAAVREL